MADPLFEPDGTPSSTPGCSPEDGAPEDLELKDPTSSKQSDPDLEQPAVEKSSAAEIEPVLDDVGEHTQRYRSYIHKVCETKELPPYSVEDEDGVMKRKPMKLEQWQETWGMIGEPIADDDREYHDYLITFFENKVKDGDNFDMKGIEPITHLSYKRGDSLYPPGHRPRWADPDDPTRPLIGNYGTSAAEARAAAAEARVARSYPDDDVHDQPPISVSLLDMIMRTCGCVAVLMATLSATAVPYATAYSNPDMGWLLLLVWVPVFLGGPVALIYLAFLCIPSFMQRCDIKQEAGKSMAQAAGVVFLLGTICGTYWGVKVP